MRARRGPRPGQAGSGFVRYTPPTKPAELEGPPEPPELELERVRDWYAANGMPYTADDLEVR